MAKNKNEVSTPAVTPAVSDGRSRRVMTDETRAKLAASRAKPRTSVHEFVHSWMNGETIVAIAAELDVTPASVQTRAKTLRKLGVKLPERPLGGRGRGGSRGTRAGYSALTVEQLNALIAGAQNGTLAVDSDGLPTVDGARVSDIGSDAPADDGDDMVL